MTEEIKTEKRTRTAKEPSIGEVRVIVKGNIEIHEKKSPSGCKVRTFYKKG